MNTTPSDLSAKKKRFILVSNLAVLSLVVCLVVGAAVMTVNAYYGMTTRNSIADCVEVGGTCFKRGQQRTKAVVEKLIEENNLSEVATRRVVIIAAVCADNPEVRAEPDKALRIRLMERCVNSELDQDRKKP